MSDNPETILREMVRRDPRYKPEAYRFMFEALEFTLRRLGQRRHISGRELLDGARDCAREQFGGLAKTVLNHWGVARTEDFGEIVFNLVDAGMMGRTENDSREDFRDGYAFDEAFPVDFVSGR